jgi:hypothetical protein
VVLLSSLSRRRWHARPGVLWRRWTAVHDVQDSVDAEVAGPCEQVAPLVIGGGVNPVRSRREVRGRAARLTSAASAEASTT